MFCPKTVFHIGDKVWTYASNLPGIIGPLTIREKDDDNCCVASNDETVIRLHQSGFAWTRSQAVAMAKEYYKQMIKGTELALEEKEERLKAFCKKEGIE